MFDKNGYRENVEGSPSESTENLYKFSVFFTKTKNVERLFRKDKRLFFQCIGFIVNISQVPVFFIPPPKTKIRTSLYQKYHFSQQFHR